MKILKLIGLMLLTANFVMAQTDSYFAPEQGQTGDENVYVGQSAGAGASGKESVFVGKSTGINASGDLNVFVGKETGFGVSGTANVALGTWTFKNGQGNKNMILGHFSGYEIQSSENVIIGANAGKNFGKNSTEPNINNRGRNVAIGYGSGFHATGDRNVFIGTWAGRGLTDISDQLYIQNSDFESSEDPTTPLIYGDFATKQVGIGTNDVAGYALAVKGHVVAEEITVKAYSSGWADYVFAENYDLMSLTELEKEIEKLGHLPEVPSTEDVLENGHKVGEMDVILLKKVEELTLYLIEMNKAIETLQENEKELREENEALKNELNEQNQTLEESEDTAPKK